MNVMVLIAQIALGVIIAAAEPTGTLTLACKGGRMSNKEAANCGGLFAFENTPGLL
jgi:hypothetical protein